uniref:Signal recognition particle receptor subunit alpha homolog n=1 Tax=Blastobotrys adeninivorans TaxID=409370 RepID=A0A060T8U9_BLAAD
MLDLLLVFTNGGVVLWKKQQQKVPDSVVNGLIVNRFIDDQHKNDAVYVKDSYTVRYSHVNERGLTFAVAYRSILQVAYAPEFLNDMKRIFMHLYGEEIDDKRAASLPIAGIDFSKFNAMMDLRLEKVEEESTPSTSVAAKVSAQAAVVGSNKDTESDNAVDSANEREETPEASEGTGTPELQKKARRRGKKSKHSTPLDSPSASGGEESRKPKPKKQMRRWGEDGVAEVAGDDVVLDFSTSDQNDQDAHLPVEEVDVKSWGSANKKGEFILNDLSTELDDILKGEDTKSGGASVSNSSTGSDATGVMGFFKKYTGGKKLSEEDLKKALDAMKDQLLKKNVASEVADHLCSVVQKNLVGSTTKSWTTVEATVKESMTEALRRILTPNTSLDLLHEVQKTKQRNEKGGDGRPYVISVVGVNGVGKSTNLSKIAFWLLQNKMKVLVAACDTFRSGAVEQLKVHVRRLQELTDRMGSGEVDIFDQGYGKDAAVIAQKSIDYGKRNGFDVVLIDTAGRRHNDERLMSSLEKFGKLANPDKIIMVGEALVGTDSVQQAKNFNSAFGSARNLDFFLISKCDTVGDMIGSMVNMSYSTGIPVLFVGVGQNYTDLRNLSVDWAVKLLMN